ncbi:hypothetical protein [Pinibacter soli]|uniref:Lipocalin-like domain-containing protein n=1 Tax=Pinibacter soli TaxID=3044211 RepID=A0ABT6RDC0_9BACT|nr:hypothetical protein [Pinibacter soli]MDI3320530.1 hypothetical protein [Pinibacter soli]
MTLYMIHFNVIMKYSLAVALLCSALLFYCKPPTNKPTEQKSLDGTWQLVSALSITKQDTVVTFPIKNQQVVKIFNQSHFAFFKHDHSRGKDSTAVFGAGSGSYKLEGENYSEHLEYCNARGCENNDFHFTLSINNDTLIQRGIEKIDSLGVDRVIEEIYRRIN